MFSVADLPTLPQNVVDFSAGLGDGIIATMTFGVVNGQDLRNYSGNGGVNTSSPVYQGGHVAGTVGTLAVNAFGAIPSSLTHFTTITGAAHIAASGTIRPSGGLQLFGHGRYGSSIGGFPRNLLVPPASTISVSISNTSGFYRTIPGTFLQPTFSGGAQLAGMNASYGAFLNFDVFFNPDCP